jgi:Concanavalin A-like lectin/glucanases superfamily
MGYSDLVKADGAVAYWRLGETSGTRALDCIGGYTGDISGGVTLGQPGATNDGNTAMAFDGSTGLITVPDGAYKQFGTGPCSVEMWLKETGVVSFRSPVDLKNDGATAEAGVAFLVNSPHIYWEANPAGGTGSIQLAANNVLNGQWHHIVGVVERGATDRSRIYVDGVLRNTQDHASAGWNLSSGLSMAIGAARPPVGFFPGALDDVAIYPTALTPAQIQAHYALATQPPATSAIHRAVTAQLQGDAALRALLPDGIWADVAPPGKTKFALVDVFDAVDESVFGGRAIESVRYAVRATVLGSAPDTVRAAADRIDVLLSEVTLTIPGYVFMSCCRDDDQPLIDYVEQNATDATIVWRHAGGHYRVTVSVPGR